MSNKIKTVVNYRKHLTARIMTAKLMFKEKIQTCCFDFIYE
jgi:hypothetical protein